MFQSRLWLLVLLGALSGLTPLSIDMYLPALPTIASDLQVSIETVQLTVSTFLAGFALGQLFYGPLADSVGRKPVMLFGLGVFILASAGCVFATSLPWLLACRLLQALGGAAGSVVVNALLRDLFRDDEFVRAMTMVILTMTLAPLVAPLLGGVLLHISWRSIFVLLVVLGCLVWLLVGLRLPETLKPELRQPLRPRSVLANYGHVLCHRRAMSSLLASTFASAGLFAFISGSPYVYITYFGVPAQHYGLLFGMNVLLLMLTNWVNGRVVKRVGLLRMLRCGLVLGTLASMVLLLNALTGWGGLWGIVAPVVCYIGLMGLIGANSTSHALGFFPANAGTASALAGTLRFGGGALAGMLVNLLPAVSPLPMAATMAVTMWLALLAHLFWGRATSAVA